MSRTIVVHGISRPRDLRVGVPRAQRGAQTRGVADAETETRRRQTRRPSPAGCRDSPTRRRSRGSCAIADAHPRASGSPSPSSAPRRRRARSRARRRARDRRRRTAATGTCGVISGTNQGRISAPRLPGGAAASAAENPGQSNPYASRTRSRASDPLLKTVNPMKSPVGAPNTWPVPVGSMRGVAHQAEERVARAQRDADAPFVDESGADEAARVVAGPHDDARGRQTVALAPVRRERADHGR